MLSPPISPESALPTEDALPSTLTETPVGPREVLSPGILQMAAGFDLGVGASDRPFGAESIETLTPAGLQARPETPEPSTSGTYSTVAPPEAPRVRNPGVGLKTRSRDEPDGGEEDEEESYSKRKSGCTGSTGEPFSDRILLPPPLTRAASTPMSKGPGQVEYDRSTNLLQHFITYQGITKFIIDIYDNWIHNILPLHISSVTLTLPGGDNILFKGLVLGPPIYTDDHERPMYPQYARNNALTYGLDLYTDAIHYTRDPSKAPDPTKVDPDGYEVARSRVYIGKIPLMLGSFYCYLSKMTELDLIAAGEDPKDPFGYFIVKGNQKVTKIQEQLGTGKVMIFPQKAKNPPVCRMTVATPNRGTPLLLMSLGEDRRTIEWQLSSIDKRNNQRKAETINVLALYALFNLPDIEDIKTFLSYFIRPERRVNCFNKLLVNIVRMSEYSGDVYTYMAGKLSMSPDATPEQKKEAVDKLLYEETFPHLDPKTLPTSIRALLSTDPTCLSEYLVEVQKGFLGNYYRIGLLSYMLARFLEYLAGYRKADNRDDWAFKKLETGGRLMEQMFRSLWRRALRGPQKGIIEGAYTNLQQVTSAIDPNIITSEFHDSFNTSHWGVKNIFTKENVSETLNTDSYLSALSHLLRIDVNVDRSGRNKDMRQIGLSSQLGFVCPAETPEGDPIGIVKNLAVTALISMGRSDDKILQYLFLIPNVIRVVFQPVPGAFPNVLLCNGKFLGWCNGTEVREFLRLLRQYGNIPRETCIVLDFEGTLHIYTDASRVLRPLLVVNPKTQIPVIEEKDLWDRPFPELLQQGAVEYLDPFEQQYINLASSLTSLRLAREQKENATLAVIQAQADLDAVIRGENVRIPETIKDEEFGDIEGFISLDVVTAENRLNEAKNIQRRALSIGNYTHCELDPSSMFGHGAGVAPSTNHQQGPRSSYQAKMEQQALTNYHTNHLSRFDGKTKVAAFPTRDLYGTAIGEIISRPAGETVTVAVLADARTQEDAFVISQGAVDSGKFMSVKYNVYTTKVIHTIDISEELRKPTRIQPDENPERYRYIIENGLPMIGAVLAPYDCVIGKMQTRLKETNPENREVNASIFMKVGEYGIVDNVYVYTQHGTTVVQVKTRQIHKPEAGDKFVFRYSQKGTAGIIRATVDMPFSMQTGVAPDVIINPHALPSRMTIGLLMEILSGKATVLGDGRRIDATPFRPFRDDLGTILHEHGYQSAGYETFISGTRGVAFRAQVFTGVAYLSALKHQVAEKQQARGSGPLKQINRQPSRGRSSGGGLRFGEMERDMVISFGAANFLLERLMHMSDLYPSIVCQVCGTFAVQDPATSRYMCRLCGVRGKFARVEAPYATKRLVQLVAGASFNLRIRTKTPEQEEEERRYFADLEASQEEEEGDLMASGEEEEEGFDEVYETTD